MFYSYRIDTDIRHIHWKLIVRQINVSADDKSEDRSINFQPNMSSLAI